MNDVSEGVCLAIVVFLLLMALVSKPPSGDEICSFRGIPGSYVCD